jgi:metal-responsive CopG/Arc/MetJ family transcriptional regulator
MAKTSDQRAKIQISMSPATLKRLDDYCARLGVPRSTYISTVVAQNLESIERMNDAVADKVGELLAAQRELQK